MNCPRYQAPAPEGSQFCESCGSMAGVEFRDAGRRQLKGIGRQRVYEVVW